MRRLIVGTLILLATSAMLMAEVTVPEIESSSAAAALTIVAGGVLILRTRRK